MKLQTALLMIMKIKKVLKSFLLNIIVQQPKENGTIVESAVVLTYFKLNVEEIITLDEINFSEDATIDAINLQSKTQ